MQKNQVFQQNDARSTGHSQIDIICESILITSWSKWLKNLMFYGAMITLH